MTNETFIGEKSKALFNEDIDTSRNVHARSIWEEAGKIAFDVFKAVATRPTRARAYGYSVPVGDFDYAGGQDNTGGYDHVKYVAKYVDAKPANQAWLQKVTGNEGRYVFGASVNGGEDDGIYANIGLLERAGRYVKTQDEKYLPDFVQSLLTAGKSADGKSVSHEAAHYHLGVESEPEAEAHAVENVYRLGKNDHFVGKALHNYIGKNQFLRAA